MGMAHNRKKPRARRWTLEDLDRDQAYVLYFDPAAFRWELLTVDGGNVVTRTSINRRSSYPGDRAGQERSDSAGAAEAAEPRAPGEREHLVGRHRGTT